MALLHSEEYVNSKGRKVVKTLYGRVDENGNEVISATCETEFPTDAEIAEKQAKIAEEMANKAAEETAKQEQLNRIEEMLTQLLGK